MGRNEGISTHAGGTTYLGRVVIITLASGHVNGKGKASLSAEPIRSRHGSLRPHYL